MLERKDIIASKIFASAKPRMKHFAPNHLYYPQTSHRPRISLPQESVSLPVVRTTVRNCKDLLSRGFGRTLHCCGTARYRSGRIGSRQPEPGLLHAFRAICKRQAVCLFLVYECGSFPRFRPDLERHMQEEAGTCLGGYASVVPNLRPSLSGRRSVSEIPF